MAFEMRIAPEEHVAVEIRDLKDRELEMYLADLLTCSIELTLDGASLFRDMSASLPPLAKLDARGFHAIICLEFLVDLLTVIKALGEGSEEEETVSLMSSVYALCFQRSDESVSVGLEDELRFRPLGKIPFLELRRTAIAAAKSALEILRGMNPSTALSPQVSKIAKMVAGLVE